MGSVFSSGKPASEDLKMALEKAQHLVASNPLVIFRVSGLYRFSTNPLGQDPGEAPPSPGSKTYCGYCNRVKKLFDQLGARYQAIELDKESDGDAIQAALLQWTGQRTVPSVFIAGKHVGGCDAVMEKHSQGKLVPMLTESSAIAMESTA